MSKKSIVFDFKQQPEHVQRDMLLFQKGNSYATEDYLYYHREIEIEPESKIELPKIEEKKLNKNIVEESKDGNH